MEIEDRILSGYFRLWCKIKGVDVPDSPCRICGRVLDKDYKKRKIGYYCIECYHEYTRNQWHKYHRKEKNV